MHHFNKSRANSRKWGSLKDFIQVSKKKCNKEQPQISRIYGNALTPDSGYFVLAVGQITFLLGYTVEFLKLKILLGVSKS